MTIINCLARIRFEVKPPALRAAAGLAADTDLAGWIEGLNRGLDMPDGLAAMGVRPDQLTDLAALAVADHLSRTNPCPASAEDYRQILEAAM